MSFLFSLLVKDPLIILATIVMGAISVCVSPFDPDGRRQHAIARAWARLLLFLGGAKVRVRGMENIDPARNYVFVGNHLSLFDTPLVLANIPQQFLFLVAARYVKIPFLGTHLRRSGHFSVDASDTRASLKVMTEAARRIQERGLSILLFPEGSRARGGMGEFKEGAAYIAIKSQAPVVPFGIMGTREMLGIGSLHVRGVEVCLSVGEPIATEGMTLKDRERLTTLMRERVASLVADITEAPPRG
jgi:1-acyl-sn-glycerol-3-phosphate acyltransferase